MTDRELLYKIIENQGIILNVMSALLEDDTASETVKNMGKRIYATAKKGDKNDDSA